MTRAPDLSLLDRCRRAILSVLLEDDLDTDEFAARTRLADELCEAIRGEFGGMRAAFVDHPPSAEIAAALEAAGAAACSHGRNPCLLRCGVRCDVRRLPDIVTELPAGGSWTEIVHEKAGPWRVIPWQERMAVLARGIG